MEIKKHYYWLDLIRFLAAFTVLLAHYRGAFFVEYRLLPENQKNILSTLFFFLTRLGEESVLIFFVMSGLLVGGRAIEKILNNKVDVAKYILDRSVRILLPLFASIVLVVIIDLIIGNRIPFLDILGSVLSFQGLFTDCYSNAPLWSLAYEIWFYVIMAGIMLLLKGKKEKNKLWGLVLVVLVLSFFTKLSTVYLFLWFIGAFVFFLSSFQGKRRSVVFLIFILLCFFMVLSQLTSESKTSLPILFSKLDKDLIKICLGLTAAIFISAMKDIKPVTEIGIYVEKIGSKLAKFSYSLYLTHYPLMYLLLAWGVPKSTELSLTSIMYFTLTISIAIVISYVMYFLAEKHTDSIKKYLSIKMNV